jgi:tRNA modification GTPase
LAGTTRDVIEAPVAIGGTPFLLLDTAGLRDTADHVEGLGVERAQAALRASDIVLWLGAPTDAPAGSIRVGAKCDLHRSEGSDIDVSSVTGEGLDRLARRLLDEARTLLPAEDEVSGNARVREAVADVARGLAEAASSADMLIVAESLRSARWSLDRVTGRAGVEDMLDCVFARFCIGK